VPLSLTVLLLTLEVQVIQERTRDDAGGQLQPVKRRSESGPASFTIEVG
jgi:hypothetical protein